MKSKKIYWAALINVLFSLVPMHVVACDDDFSIENKTEQEVLDFCKKQALGAASKKIQDFTDEKSKAIVAFTQNRLATVAKSAYEQEALECASKKIQDFINETSKAMTALIQDVLDSIEHNQYNILLHLGCEQNALEWVECAVKGGANINEMIEGDLSLHRAIRNRNLKIVDFLLKNGANIEQCEFDGFTPLIVATTLGRTNIVEYLLTKGANVHARETRDGYKASDYSSLNQHHKKINSLLIQYETISQVNADLG